MLSPFTWILKKRNISIGYTPNKHPKIADSILLARRLDFLPHSEIFHYSLHTHVQKQAKSFEHLRPLHFHPKKVLPGYPPKQYQPFALKVVRFLNKGNIYSIFSILFKPPFNLLEYFLLLCISNFQSHQVLFLFLYHRYTLQLLRYMGSLP